MPDFSWLSEIVTELIVSVLLLGTGFLVGKHRERKAQRGKNLEEYDFYPFNLDENSHLYFDLPGFRRGVHYFLKHRDDVAARQLILIGEQNEARHQLESEHLDDYLKLYAKYNGDKIFDDTSKYLENYKRIVRLIGETFPDTGIEILLHNLTNPAKSLSYIENNVTGRKIEDGATNLVVDLKTRRVQNQDKLNYELNIGARKFKCTTIPIYRESYGLIGAICINVDVNYLNDEVQSSTDKIEAFFEKLCRTDMELDENILSKEEHKKALAGKHHWKDTGGERQILPDSKSA